MHGSVYSVALRGENHVILILTQFQKILRLGGGEFMFSAGVRAGRKFHLCRVASTQNAVSMPTVQAIKPKFSYLQQLNPQNLQVTVV